MDTIDTAIDAHARLLRVAGQITGIQRMLDEKRGCVDILNQIAAAQAALLETAKVILSGHVSASLTDASASGNKSEQHKAVNQLVDIIGRFCKLSDETRTQQSPAPRGKRPAR